MNSKDRFQRLPGKRYLDKETGQIISNSVKRRIQTGVSPGKFAKLQREKGVPNPLRRYNYLVDLRVEQQQHETRQLINELTREIKELRRSMRYNYNKKDYAEMKKMERFVTEFEKEKITRGKVAKSAEMKLILKDLKSEQGRTKRSKHIKGKPDRIYAPDSRRAKALEELGLRDYGAMHWVGDTNSTG